MQKSVEAVGTEFFQVFDEEDSVTMRPPPLVEVQPQLLGLVREASPRTTGPSLELAVLGDGLFVFLLSRALQDRK